jgi:hypothetical protein
MRKRLNESCNFIYAIEQGKIENQKKDENERRENSQVSNG